jgi:hypothetical protein
VNIRPDYRTDVLFVKREMTGKELMKSSATLVSKTANNPGAGNAPGLFESIRKRST